MEVLAESWRWLRSGAGRTSGLLIGATIAATVLVMWGSQLSREVARERKTGKLMVAASSTLMFAELSGDEVLQRFTAPTLMPIEVPVGDYQLHIGTPGQMSRVYDVTLAHDSPVVVRTDDDERRLWQLEADIEGFVRLPRADSSAADIVIADASGLRRLDGTTGRTAWTVDGIAQQEALREIAPGFDWSGGQGGYDRRRDRPTAIVSLVSAGDLNGDQVTDVVVASHRQAWLLAVSGKDGSVLWLAARGSLLNAPENIRGRFRGRYEIPSAVIGAPRRAGDLDGDGVADLVATMIDQRQGSSVQPPESLARWVEAFSGKTGESLWRFDFADATFQLPVGTDPPASFRWWYDHVSQGSRHRGSSWSRNRYTRRRAPFSWNGPNYYRPGVPHVLAYPDTTGQVQDHVLVIAGQQVVILDTATGKAGKTIESKQPIGAPLRLADVDGDGIPEVILLSEVPALNGNGGTTSTQITVHSLKRNKVLWSRTALVDFPHPDEIGNGLPDWPLFEDLDGDGRCEILMPGAAPLSNNRHACWGNLELLDGETGKARWNRQLFSVDTQFDTFTIGPDIDGDGNREVFAATLWGRMMDLYVDCLSGLDGHTLWRTRRRIRLHDQAPQEFYVGRLSWWNASGDGWPQLIVPLSSQQGLLSTRVTLFSAGTGNVTQIGFGITGTHTVDVDGDGWDELLTVSRDPNLGPAKLGCLAGIPADRRHWAQSQLRRTDTQDRWFPVADVDRDGVDDLVRVRPDGWVHAVAGATGTLLWKRRETRLIDHNAISLASQSGTDDGELDLNGDQVPDVVISISHNYLGTHPPLLALSGRDGRLLWNRGPDVQEVERDMTIVMRDLDGDGRGEVIMVAAVVPRGRRFRGGPSQRQTLYVVDGRSGNVRWQQPLQLANNSWGGTLTAGWLNDAIADFNGDGALDLAVPAETESGTNPFEVRGYDGAVGQLLWTVPLQTSPQQRAFNSLFPVLTCDAKGDRNADLVVVDGQDQSGHIGQRIRLVNGADGSIRWTTRRKNVKTRSYPRVGGPRLLRLRDPTKGTRFCLNYAAAPDQLEILDSQGAWQPTPAADPRNRPRWPVNLWACDPDGDGTDELLMLDQETLRLVAVDNVKTPLWERPLGEDRQAFEWLLWSQDPAQGVVVMYDSDAQKLAGVDLVNGSTWWTCRLGSQFVRYTNEKQLDVLNSRVAPRRAPQILAQGITETLLRQANGVMPIESERLASRPPPTLQPATSDARMVRQLPWYFDVSAGHRQLTPGFAVWAAASCLMLLVLPAAFVARMIRRRQWGLRTMLAAPGVVAVVLVVSRMNVPAWADSQLPNNLMLALAALPMVTLAYLIGRAVVQRKWRSLRLIFVVFLVVALGLAALLMTVDMTQHGQWQAGEYYSLDGWYLIVLPSTYVTGWLSVVIFLAGYFARPKRGREAGAA